MTRLTADHNARLAARYRQIIAHCVNPDHTPAQLDGQDPCDLCAQARVIAASVTLQSHPTVTQQALSHAERNPA